MLNKKKHYTGGSPDTIIGENTRSEGKITSETSLRIEGKVQGEIECVEDVTIGEHGDVEARIEGRDIIVAGKVNGDITAKGKIVITGTGTVNGNIHARVFVIEEGALFNGNSLMSAPAKESAAEPIGPRLVEAPQSSARTQDAKIAK